MGLDGVLRVTGIRPGQKELQVPIIKIETVELRIKSGEAAYITGIDTSSTDALEGFVHFTTGQQTRVSWDIEGNARGQIDAFRLSPQSMDTAEFDDLKAAVLHLVVPRVRQQLGYY